MVPKLPYFGIFWQEDLLSVFGQQFKKKLFPYFKSKHLNLSNWKILWNIEIPKSGTKSVIPKFCEQVKMPKFRNKNNWFEYFWAEIWKEYWHIWNHHPRICVIANFCRKTKMHNFGTKNALFRYFWPKMP